MEEGKEIVTGEVVAGEKDPEKVENVTTQPSTELPLEVRTKLRKLEKMETRYQGMLHLLCC